MEQTYSRYFFLKTVSISNAHLKYYSKNISSGINSQSKNRMMAGNFQYFKNFTYEYLLYLRKAFKKMTKSWLKTEDGEFQTNQEPLICKKKRKKKKINKICPLNKNGWHGNEMDFLLLTITQTFTTSDSIFWGEESIYVHKHYINSEWCLGSDSSKINFRGNTKTLLMSNPS